MHKFWLITGLCLIFAPLARAADDKFITIVNPVRISTYNPDPAASIKAQYGVISKFDLPATWLVTFGVLDKPDLVSEIKDFNKKQEIGLFLEVTENFAKKAGVDYHKTGSWHFANAVFLSGYTQEERIKFIDAVFSRFKDQFGYYPVSVGAWWVDSFSLQYMRDKYGIIANLGVADQYSTDNYQVWGTYWSTPYYPSKLHAGIPASGSDNKIGVVTLQWAPREPRRGYYSSLYSTQDYFTTPKLDINYFSRLINIFSQVTVGLESDFTPEAYGGEYTKQMQIVSQKAAAKVTMSQFAKWYTDKFPDISPEQQIESDGMVWYQSPFYRLGIDKTNSQIIDFRIYPANYREPYYLWPNREKDLRINIPSLIDSVQDPSEAWKITDLNIKTLPKYFESKNEPPQRFFKSNFISLKKSGDTWRVEINNNFKDGEIFRDWSLETKHLFKSPKNLLKTIISFDRSKFKKEYYWISPEEIVGLDKLRQLPAGKVLVYDRECLQCEYFGGRKPAVFGNYRNYIKKYSGKNIVSSREIDRNVIAAGKIKYIYLVKYDPDGEKLKQSPGDYGIEKIFENAAIQIWEVVK
ncbi:hypothetical protein HZB69_02215 [Candidatus Amesbacteria bacterium]|nr:hypothetical protein [Candidatus Amesbacteria bacterium]